MLLSFFAFSFFVVVFLRVLDGIRGGGGWPPFGVAGTRDGVFIFAPCRHSGGLRQVFINREKG